MSTSELLIRAEQLANSDGGPGSWAEAIEVRNQALLALVQEVRDLRDERDRAWGSECALAGEVNNLRAREERAIGQVNAIRNAEIQMLQSTIEAQAAQIAALKQERNEARYHARVLASAWNDDACPPFRSVSAGLAYDVD